MYLKSCPGRVKFEKNRKYMYRDGLTTRVMMALLMRDVMSRRR